MPAIIAKVSPNTVCDVATNFIQGVHHISSTAKRKGPVHAVAKIKSWDTSEEIKSALSKTNQSDTSTAFVSKI